MLKSSSPKKINVVSLFDGMSCGRIAIDRANIEVGDYYSSEIDRYAIKVSQENYPEIIPMANILNWRKWNIDWSKVDLLMGGSPCQGFSFAGKQTGTKAKLPKQDSSPFPEFFDELIIESREMYLDAKQKGAIFLSQSFLFWEFVLCLDHAKKMNPGIKFLLENVRMKKEILDMISDAIGVKPVLINSALVSAQNRERFYWFNWEINQPRDKEIFLKDIIQSESDNFTFMSETFVNRQKGRKCLIDSTKPKSATLSAMEYVKNGRQGDYLKWGNAESAYKHGLRGMQIMPGSKAYALTGTCAAGGKALICQRPRGKNRGGIKAIDGKTPTLSANSWEQNNHLTDGVRYRKLTPVECERLQTVPDNYTNHVSNTQRYKMLGNGWTVDVITHILKGGFLND